MGMKKKHRNVLSIILIGLFLFSSCTNMHASLAEQQVLRSVMPKDPKTIDPQRAENETSFLIVSNVMEGLVRINYQGKVEPGLAKSWTVSKDGLVYTFSLRDALWSDGTPVTAADIEHSMKRALEPGFFSKYIYQMFLIKNAYEAKYKMDRSGNAVDISLAEVGIQAIDEKTLQITLNEPAAQFPGLLANPIFIPSKKEATEQGGASYGAGLNHYVFSGPFIITEWISDTKISMEKNPSYWDKDKVYLSNIVIDIDAQTSNSIGKFQQGAYDVIQIPQSFIAQFTDKKEYRQMADTTTWFLQFNCKNKYFANPKIRQAFAMAVDKEIFINQVRKGLGLKAYALSHPLIALEGAYPLKDAKKEISPLSFHKGKANRLLDEGLSEIGANREQMAQEVQFLGGEGEMWQSISDYFVQQFAEVFGMTFTVTRANDIQRFTMMKDGQYALTYSGIESDYYDPLSSLEILQSQNVNNLSSFQNEAYDEAIAKMKTKQTRRKKVVVEAEKILAMEVPLYPVCYSVYTYAIQNNVKNLSATPTPARYDWKYTYIEKTK